MSSLRDSGRAHVAGVLAAAIAGQLFSGGCDDEGGGPAVDSGARPLGDAGVINAPADGPLGVFESIPCWFELPPATWQAPTCGYVRVPEDRSQPEGRRVLLAVARLSLNSAAERRPDPLVYLEGGPGGHALDTVVASAEEFAALLTNGNRELVVIDQRGTGSSTPRLNCPEVNAENRRLLGKSVATEADKKAATDAWAACRARLSRQAALEQYGTGQNAADVEAVRVALGLPPWNLFGVSYGTRLALEVMRAHPQGVRSVVLDSVVPPDVNWIAEAPPAFDRLLKEVTAACARHFTCSRAYPSFFGQVLALVQSRNVIPLTFKLSDGTPVVMRGGDLLGVIRLLGYSSEGVSVLPEFVQQLTDGNTVALAMIFEALLEVLSEGIDVGMHRTVTCSEVLPIPARPETVAATAAMDPVLRSALSGDDADGSIACSQWALPPAAPALIAPVTSALPTLLISGHFDPATPPAFAERVASTLGKPWNFVVSSGSHGSYTSPCGKSLMDKFLTDPETRPASTCAGGPPTVDFLVPPQRLPSARLVRADSPSRDPLLSAVDRLIRTRLTPLGVPPR
jgi:pimeloyl-ACP methyl ester carboxylesterase